MNLQLTLGNETYGINDAGAAITTVQTINTLKAGSYIMLVDEVITTPTDIKKGERFQIIVGLAGTTAGMQKTMASVPIRKASVLGVSHDVWAADVKGTWTISGANLTADSEGEAHLVLNDHSYNRTIQNSKLVVTLNKTKGETVAAFLQRTVDKINAKAVKGYNLPFVVATLASTTITLVVQDANIDFTISRDGLFATSAVVNTVKAGPSITRTSDLIASEKEYRGNLGNGNYEKLTDAWFSMPLQTVANVNYDIFNIRFKGNHDTPQNRVRSAVMNLKIAIPTAKGAAFKAFLYAVINAADDAPGGE